MKTLIFDFDGTLADSFELVIDIVYELTGIPHQNETEVARLRKLPLLKAAREMKIPLSRAPGLLLRGRQMMHERIHEVHPFPGIPEVLQQLHETGYHMLVMSSNSEQNVRTFLRANDLESYFDGVYGGASVISKAGALKRVMRRNRLVPANCYYVGDEVRDIVAATKAGIEPIAVTWGYQAPEALAEYHPYALVNDPAELLAVSTRDKV
jgi:phosphoglycolate phosphatase-like HAD superfamily hydrolase